MAPLRALTLTLTEHCNLRCGYCYMPDQGLRTMPTEVVDAAIDLLVGGADASSELQVSFFGGEPFLRRDRMERAIHRARAAAGPGRRLRVLTPTNALLLDEEARELCRREGIELAISIDGDSGPSERRTPDGRDVTSELLARLPTILALEPSCRLTARMTVTPSNVERLARHVRAMVRLGFHHIVFQPAYELDWSDDDVRVWADQHRRIGTWLVGRASTGKPLPDLEPWKSIEAMLLLGRRKQPCGAGVRLAAVSPDGTVHPCYRFQAANEWKLGTVFTGLTEQAAIVRCAALHPNDLAPLDGECSHCEAHDGCGYYCPAMSTVLTGDPLRAPDVACRLSRAQVEAIRPYAAVTRRSPREAPSRLSTALLAAAVAASTEVVVCAPDPGAGPWGGGGCIG